jgi:hypothetical protein
MHIHDRRVPAPLFFRVALITVLAAGIGCDGKSASKDAGPADAGKDVATADGARSPDVSPPDTARGDLAQASDLRVETDTSKADAPPVSPDAPPLDGAMGDRPPQTDVPIGTDARIDAASVDSGLIDGSDAFSDTDALSPAPARITFAFKNTGTQVVYIQMECALQFQVVSEVTSTVYPNKSICLCQCSDPTCQDLPNCPPCAPRSGLAVEPGKTYEITWTAQTGITKDKTGSRGTFKCMEYSPIPTGAYRVSIPIFASESDAAANTNPSTASLSFQLTTANAKIEVPLR